MFWHMTEDDWLRYVRDHDKRNANVSADIYGKVHLGELCFEFHHTLDPNDWYPFCEVFVLGVDSGYGKTKNETPYGLHDGDIYMVPIIYSRSFGEFKELVEQSIWRFVDENNLIIEAASQHGWEGAEDAV